MPWVRRVCEVVRRFIAFDEGLDVSDYVTHLERRFAVTLGSDDIEPVHMLGEMADLIGGKMREGGRTSSDDEVWTDVRRITSEEWGIDERELHPGMRYVEDLCC